MTEDTEDRRQKTEFRIQNAEKRMQDARYTILKENLD